MKKYYIPRGIVYFHKTSKLLQGKVELLKQFSRGSEHIKWFDVSLKLVSEVK
jgi:hypothetical protein